MVGFYLPEGVVVVLLAPRGRIKKGKTFIFPFLYPPPQDVPVTRCVPPTPDFDTLVWSWSSKNVAFYSAKNVSFS